MEKRIRFTIILVLILIVVIAFSFQSKEKKEYLVYNEALDKIAVTVDDVSLTLKDIAFYVAYEEKQFRNRQYSIIRTTQDSTGMFIQTGSL